MEIELITLSDLEKLKKEIIQEIKQLLIGRQENESQGSWVKSKEVQKILQISAGTLQTLRNRKMIPFTKVGGVIYYKREDLRKVMEKDFSQNLDRGNILGRIKS